MHDSGECRFVQRHADRREIFAIVTGGPAPGGHGPLPLGHVIRRRFAEARLGRFVPRGDPALAADLAARAGEFHDLDDFYACYGYPREVLDWVARIPRQERDGSGYYEQRGYLSDEAASMLGVDLAVLHASAWKEAVEPGRLDPAGDTLYYTNFAVDMNWAVTAQSGPTWIDVSSYRFKAWLSFLPGPGDRRP
ncbi:hypothetical protein [Dactylosporangium sp. NPDC049140]|uniref:hypothetical protein n=1 Tax=Dactylosporangium sp. NPDC049140 TaxID=3155647 RepID=UPI0033E31FAD